MTQTPEKRTPRRGRVFPSHTIPSEELARRQAEDSALYHRCRSIFERVRPEVIDGHYNWFIVIEPDSGDYFIDSNEEVADQKARQKHPDAILGTFCLNETGACGQI
ncbi:hypothetical protein [Kamptonema formosum]|uniref:hypothetical protein n=1 Tax=Kamptonema formosum TaxID=331992 RepID=UPI000348BBAA|nr:hypothetical protein [Oscillatoria sp. PCC 10802]